VETEDFLFTWKPDKWDYKNLKSMIDRFEADETVVESWRCQAHKQVRTGARGYLYNQGRPPNGIFGVAQVIGPAKKRANGQEGEGEYEVPLRFELLLDPTKGRFLVTKEQIQVFSEEVNLNTQSSGIGLPARLARTIDEMAGRNFHGFRPAIRQGSSADPLPQAKRERLSEVYDRDQSIVDELKRIYGGRCQICASVPFNGLFGNIVEGHHIEWLSRNDKDIRENIILLCPNHHAAVHAADPTFDRAKLEFRFGAKIIPIRLDSHLKII